MTMPNRGIGAALTVPTQNASPGKTLSQFRITAEDIAQALNGRKNGKGWMVLCPAHADRNPSLSLSETSSGKLLVHCFAGCPQRNVISALQAKNLWHSRGAN